VHADPLLRPLFDALRPTLAGASLVDAHTHIGQNDPDGFSCSAAELTEALEAADARGVAFAMHEPGGYRDANDAAIAAAEASGGRFVAFCRLDPRVEDAVAEAERALDAGAKGIKLHPRAERFALHDEIAAPIFALAEERRVPVLVHAGRGIPALGRDAVVLAERHPGAPIILAHCGISDLAWLWSRAGALPNLLFDTSWWSSADLLALCSLVPPGQILYASDAPYGTPVQAAIVTARCALQAGVTPEQLQGIMGGQMARLVAGEEPLDLGPPPGAHRLATDLLLDRVHTFVGTAVGRLMEGGDGLESLGLARLACDVPPDAAQYEVCRAILGLLDAHRTYVVEHTVPEGAPRFPGMHLLIIAAVLARTPDVPVPAE
jgi:predicted TIM-barrel fold metal-dependent hydrolase